MKSAPNCPLVNARTVRNPPIRTTKKSRVTLLMPKTAKLAHMVANDAQNATTKTMTRPIMTSQTLTKEKWLETLPTTPRILQTGEGVIAVFAEAVVVIVVPIEVAVAVTVVTIVVVVAAETEAIEAEEAIVSIEADVAIVSREADAATVSKEADVADEAIEATEADEAEGVAGDTTMTSMCSQASAPEIS